MYCCSNSAFWDRKTCYLTLFFNFCLQGLPFCVNGTADLLALFRCISCKYKFTTDTTKSWLMGPGEFSLPDALELICMPSAPIGTNLFLNFLCSWPRLY